MYKLDTQIFLTQQSFTKMKRITSLCLLSILMYCSNLLAQKAVGHFFDINGLPINGYYDPLSYSPEKYIECRPESERDMFGFDIFERGVIYLKDGKQLKGEIKVKRDKLVYKAPTEARTRNIKFKDLDALVLSTDSFFVSQDVYSENKVSKQKLEGANIVQYIASFDGYIFSKYHQLNYNDKATFLVQKEGSERWISFAKTKDYYSVYAKKNLNKKNPNTVRFRNTALAVFDKVDLIKEKIENYDYSTPDMMEMIKTAEYYHKYQNGEAIYFDKYWNETHKQNKAKYTANIISLEDTIWTLDYHQNDTLLYTVQYSSFYPNVKDGLFIAYYPNGNPRKKIYYENNKPEFISTFYENGQDKFKMYTDVAEIRNPKYEFAYFYDENGIDKLTETNEQALKIEDKIQNRTINFLFKDKKLEQSTIKQSEEAYVYQNCSPFYNDFFIRNVEKLQKKFDMEMQFKLLEAYDEGAQGTILVAVDINEKGKIQGHKLLNSLHPELDRIVNKFMNGRAVMNYKFKSLKFNNNLEIVIPFVFKIDNFHINSPNHYWYDPWFHNQMQWHMQQQQFQQNIPSPPSFNF